MPLDLRESIQCILHDHEQLLGSRKYQSQSRWQSNCTGFHGKHVRDKMSTIILQQDILCFQERALVLSNSNILALTFGNQMRDQRKSRRLKIFSLTSTSSMNVDIQSNYSRPGDLYVYAQSRLLYKSECPPALFQLWWRSIFTFFVSGFEEYKRDARLNR